jgi:hypothetical protein
MESRRDRLSNECELESAPARSCNPIGAPANQTSKHAYTELLQRLAIQILHFNDSQNCKGDEK